MALATHLCLTAPLESHRRTHRRCWGRHTWCHPMNPHSGICYPDLDSSLQRNQEGKCTGPAPRCHHCHKHLGSTDKMRNLTRTWPWWHRTWVKKEGVGKETKQKTRSPTWGRSQARWSGHQSRGWSWSILVPKRHAYRIWGRRYFHYVTYKHLDSFLDNLTFLELT